MYSNHNDDSFHNVTFLIPYINCLQSVSTALYFVTAYGTYIDVLYSIQGHLPGSLGCPLNGGSTVYDGFHRIYY